MDAETLKKIIEDHKLWLDGKGGSRSDFNKADLSKANLCGVNLSKANLYGADLSEANLRGGDLSEASLTEAILSDADLRWAKLSGTDLHKAGLFRVNLVRADLHDAGLGFAHLRRADLRGANLVGADIDFSVLPLWCGGLKWEIDGRIAAQLMYQICTMQCGDPEFIDIQNKALAYANRSHLVKLCGELSPVEAVSKEEEAER